MIWKVMTEAGSMCVIVIARPKRTRGQSRGQSSTRNFPSICFDGQTRSPPANALNTQIRDMEQAPGGCARHQASATAPT